MCGRLSLATGDVREIAAALSAEVASRAAAEYRPRFNIVPTESHWQVRVVKGRRSLERARWGVERVLGHRDPSKPRVLSPFNTRSERAINNSTWRRALHERRCVVPATGIYEWKETGRSKAPFHFTRRDGGLLLLAAIYDEEKDGELPRFSILTTASNEFFGAFHHRMPVILSQRNVDGWLSDGGDRYLRSAPVDLLVATPANPIVGVTGKRAADGPECLILPSQAAHG